MASKDTNVVATKKATNKVTPLTVDMSKRIEDMNAQELRAYQKRLTEIAKEKAAAEKAAKASEKKEVDEGDVVAEPLVLLPGNGLIELPLSALVPLDAGVFPDGEYAMRKIDKTHRDHLLIALEQGAKFPPMDGVLTNYGTVILDGNHRWDVYSSYMKQLLFNDGKISSLDPEKQTDADRDVIAEATQTTLVWVNEMTFDTPADAIDHAFKANLAHGLASSEQSRSRYGLWIHKHMADIGTPISLREAARRAGVAYGTLSVTFRRAQGIKKLAKMVDTILSPEDQEALDEVEVGEKEDRTVATDDKHIKALIAAARHFAQVDWIDGNNIEKRAAEYMRPMLAKVTREEMAALGTVVTSMSHMVNQHMKEKDAGNGQKAVQPTLTLHDETSKHPMRTHPTHETAGQLQ